MIKLSQFLLSRNTFSKKLLSGKAGDIKDALRLHDSTARQDITIKGSYLGMVYADYTFYKGKAALTMSPLLPTFSKMDSGGFKLDRRGAMILKFSPAIASCKYDYQKKQVIALSPTEVGSLISLGPNDSCEFFHDPSIKTSNAGQVRKSFSVTPISDAGGYFVSLNVVNSNLKINERFSVPLTNAEFAVMRTAFSFVLPYIMGWDQYSRKLPTSIEEPTPRVVQQITDSEWDK